MTDSWSGKNVSSKTYCKKNIIINQNHKMIMNLRPKSVTVYIMFY